MSSKLKGFCHPLSPEGKAQMIGAPPWHFSEDIMMINFLTDPDQIRRCLPDELELGSTPGLGQVWFTSAVSFSDTEKDLIYTNPERVYYKECVISVGCRYKGVDALKITYIWVDNDFTLLRGWFQGFPKKLARIHVGWENRHLYALNKGLGEFGTGTKIKAFMESHGDRLATGTMTLGRKITPEELPVACKMKFLQIQHFPNIEIGSTQPLVNQLADSFVKLRFGDIWEASAADLKFTGTDMDEINTLQPIEITGAYLVNIGITVQGTKVLHNYLEK
jgi:acetoacetate decarboxylase